MEDGEGKGDSSDGGEDGRDKNHNSDVETLVPVKKGIGEEGVSKNKHGEVVEIACPKGRMRGETPNKE